MKEISFEGMGQTAVTMKTATELKKGAILKISANDTVAPCAAGEAICGVALGDSRDGCVAALIGGCCTAGYTGTAPAHGFAKLTADGTGGVKVGTATDREVLVLSVDTAGKSVTIKL